MKIAEADRKGIDAAVKRLNVIRERVQVKNPDLQVDWYLDGSENLCLMIEPVGQMEPDQQYIAHEARLRASGGGDW